jgi:hypothetical protein
MNLLLFLRHLLFHGMDGLMESFLIVFPQWILTPQHPLQHLHFLVCLQVDMYIQQAAMLIPQFHSKQGGLRIRGIGL